MIEFATLFLGLVAGSHAVTVLPTEDVATVEVRLNGALAGEARPPEWTVAVDFGSELAPHLLEAVARNEAGKELGRALQRVNLPREPSEAHVVVRREEGGLVARVAFDSVVSEAPESVQAALDGDPLEVGDPERIPLPDLDLRKAHVLRVDLDFPSGIATSAELVLGGAFGEATDVELSAVPVRLGRGRREPTAEELAGHVHAGGEALRPVTVDTGLADLVVVPGEGALADLREFAERLGVEARPNTAQVVVRAPMTPIQHLVTLARDQRLRILVPQSKRRIREGPDAEGFAVSPHLDPRTGGLLWWLLQAPTVSPSQEPQRLADAVAIAGLAAAETSRRRAVVLLIGNEPADASAFEPAAVKRFLARLGVPLVVWSTRSASAGTTAKEWGEAERVSTLRRLERASNAVGRTLDRQRVVWVEGRPLPSRIEVDLPGVERVGADVDGATARTEARPRPRAPAG